MNLLTLLVCNLITCSHPTGSTNDLAEEWKSFKLSYNKTYSDKRIESKHRYIFTENKKLIDTFNTNQNGSSFTLGLNHRADWDETDISKGFRISENAIENTIEAEQYLQSIYDNGDPIPDEIDWRKVPGRVLDVKDQGKCDGGWAFATTGVLEGQEKFHAAKGISNPIPLSEQNLIDCVIVDFGCSGGLVNEGLYYVSQEGGINDEKSYPFEAKNGKCRFNKSKSVITDKGYAILPFYDEQKLKEVVAKFGPVAVGIETKSKLFTFYKQGVYYNDDCENNIDHAALVVGYGTDSKQGDYWIVKNSWGMQWGEEGYIRMARNRDNNCGIASIPVIPAF